MLIRVCYEIEIDDKDINKLAEHAETLGHSTNLQAEKGKHQLIRKLLRESGVSGIWNFNDQEDSR